MNGDANWKDKLATYTDASGATHALTYDTIGTPTTYKGYAMAWEHGRQLAGMSKSGSTLSFGYDADGVRISKTVNGVETKYYAAGDQILRMERGDDALDFLYDEAGAVFGVLHNDTPYYYVRNGQNDIVALVDQNANIIGQYSYDAWGKPLQTTGDAEIVSLNPFRYRGYVYDEESGLYYLTSRYYDPDTCRFISPDDIGLITATPTALTDKNLYTYCDNNPVMREDKGGRLWFLVGAAIGALSVYVGDVIQNISNGESGWDVLKPTSTVGEYLGAAASGMIPGGGIASMAARTIVGTGVKYTVDCGIRKEQFEPRKVISDLVLNGAGEALSFGVNKVLHKAEPRNYSSFRHQMTKRVPKITQQQTRQLMRTVTRAVRASIKALEFAISVGTNW